ncbi:zona pellucida sperm-binding protein 3-like [Salvelinus fontinalis]|uniref:zona pellucida sperm-binding protein 3-like n=1 Tax=Salvelinus fontinalis TaxID=8038 RepID=UPI002485C924|nr:zona pellucida sperm-binding protein 3-like [Salvelinus fontinalis]
MAIKWSVVCLVAVAMLGCLCVAQNWPAFKPNRPSPQQPQQPPYQKPRIPPKDQTQAKQKFDTPLDWSYPLDPKPEPKIIGSSEARTPVAANSVRAECRENMVHVEAKHDLLGIGQLIQLEDLTLGDCPMTAFDNINQVLIFESPLQSCGSQLRMTTNSLIYIFTLFYKPKPLANTPLIRTNDAMIIIECHYPRKHNVSSLALIPTWTPFSAAKYAEELLYFSMRLMTADWQYERAGNMYVLGDMVNIEASVMQYFHVPLRIFVDSCVATLEPNINANPRYAFIENHGCLIDAKMTGSHSQFMPRSADYKLYFQVEAFRFQSQKGSDPIYPQKTKIPVQAASDYPATLDMIFITCHLKATTITFPIDFEYKACSFINTWREAGGNDGVCGCCDSTCSNRKGRDTTKHQNPANIWEGDVQLGPIFITEKVAQ